MEMAVLLVISMPGAVGWWFIVHPFVGFWRRVGVPGTLTVLTVFLLGSAGGLYLLRELLVGPDLGTYWPLLGLALPLIVVAAIIQRKRRKHLTLRVLTGVAEILPESGKLLTEGIYGRIRHPRYVEFTLGLVGWSLVANYLGPYLMAAGTVAALLIIVEMEERELRERFGDAYDMYARLVPRFLPRRRADSGSGNPG
jgi:protein-S-isoprenylcysteine O-methyltransferase Ste14